MIKRIFIGFFICSFFLSICSCSGYGVYCSWDENLLVKFNEINLSFPSEVFFNSNNLTSFDNVFDYSSYDNNPQITFTTTAKICSNEKKQSKNMTFLERDLIDVNDLSFMPNAYGAESYAHTFEIKVVWENVMDEFGRRGSLTWQKTYVDQEPEEDNPNFLVIPQFINEGKFVLSKDEYSCMPILRGKQFINIYY